MTMLRLALIAACVLVAGVARVGAACAAAPWAPRGATAASAGAAGGGPARALGDLAAAALPAADPPQQVRIEQHLTIRISPGGPGMPPDVLLDMREDDSRQRLIERSIGRCVAMSNILAVQGGSGNRLILFMRDQKIVSAALEKTCEPRDFYSGFYVSRSTDGMLCANRDTLQSRSGANCRVRRLKGLIAVAERR